MRKARVCVIVFLCVIGGVLWDPPDTAPVRVSAFRKPIAAFSASLPSTPTTESAPREKESVTPPGSAGAVSANLRAVTITVMIDRELLADTKKDITLLQVVSLMQDASAAFTHNFGISFFYTIVPWNYLPDEIEVDIHKALDDVRAHWDTQTSDLTIGLTKKGLYYESCADAEAPRECQKMYKGGVAYVLGNSAVLSMHFVTVHAFLHEFGHLFGALHPSADTPSVMSAVSSSVTLFDEKNKDIIMKHRNRTFRSAPIP